MNKRPGLLPWTSAPFLAIHRHRCGRWGRWDPGPDRIFDAAKAFESAVATPDARIEDGSAIRVKVARSNGRPGVVFQPAAGAWDLTGLGGVVETRVKNIGSRPLSVHLSLENPGADRTERKGCVIESAWIPPGAEQVLKVTAGFSPTRVSPTGIPRHARHAGGLRDPAESRRSIRPT